MPVSLEFKQGLNRLDADQRASLECLRTWNATRTDYPRDRTVVQLFEEIASSRQHHTALLFEGRELSYGELNARANRLAHQLRQRRVGPETMDGCCVDRSFDLIVALLAILKAGGAYVPLDPAYPKERLKILLEDTQAPVMLTQASIASTLLGDCHQDLLLVDAEQRTPDSFDVNPAPAGGPTTLAYVMFTSGSTGRPKGVMVENRAIVRLVRNTNYCRFGVDEVFLQFAPISFDASTLEIWGPLLNGGQLAIMPPGPASLEDLGRAIREQGVTTLWLTAGLFSRMVDERLHDLRPLRQLLAGGDVLSSRHVRAVLENLPDCCLTNGYGPTENTTFTCCHSMHHKDQVSDSIPIGRPISNTWVYILDEQLRQVPPGMAGELYAAGDGLARGYLNSPELTEQKFLADPFDPQPGARMYRTGDLARWRSDGAVEFLGRVDNQIKISGYRIEPSEVEAVLGKHDRIKQNCVVPHTDGNGSKRLVAYYVPSDPALTVADLRNFLATQLPQYMIPALFVPLESLPLTPNGKVDRAVLPKPSIAIQAKAATSSPATQAERTIMEVWRKHLDTLEVGLNENFFDVGGDSLILVAVHADLEKHFQRHLPITELFKFTTVRSLAHHLGGDKSAESALSEAQQRAQKQRAALARQRERARSGRP